MYVLFLLMFFYVPFDLELFSTNNTGITSYKCSFMCKRHLKHINVKCVENISRENIESQNTCKKKAQAYFGSQSKISGFQKSFTNTKVPKNFLGFNNHAQRSTIPYYLDLDNPFVICWIYFLFTIRILD